MNVTALLCPVKTYSVHKHLSQTSFLTGFIVHCLMIFCQISQQCIMHSRSFKSHCDHAGRLTDPSSVIKEKRDADSRQQVVLTRIFAPVSAFQSQAVKSSDPARMTSPLGCQCNHSIVPVGPSSMRLHCPEEVSHTPTFPAPPAPLSLKVLEAGCKPLACNR